MMLELSRLDLLSPYPTWVDGVGSILSPTITAISRLGGEGEYNARVNTLLINKAQFLESISENLTEAQLKELDKLPLLVLLCLFDNVRDVLLDALNFFIAEDVLFSAEAACFVTEIGRAHV